MYADRDWLRLHIEAEFTHDANGRMVRINEPRGGVAPRFWLGQAPDGSILRRYRNDLPDSVRDELEAASAAELLPAFAAEAALDPAPWAAILARSAPLARVTTGLAFRFAMELPRIGGARRLQPADAAVLRPLLPAWMADLEHSQPLVAVVLEGRAVAVCGSVRITPAAHEAGVETAPAFRGRGYAAAAVAAWAAEVRAGGTEPLYSTVSGNAASRAVARKLGLVCVGRDLHVT